MKITVIELGKNIPPKNGNEDIVIYYSDNNIRRINCKVNMDSFEVGRDEICLYPKLLHYTSLFGEKRSYDGSSMYFPIRDVLDSIHTFEPFNLNKSFITLDDLYFKIMNGLSENNISLELQDIIEKDILREMKKYIKEVL